MKIRPTRNIEDSAVRLSLRAMAPLRHQRILRGGERQVCVPLTQIRELVPMSASGRKQSLPRSRTTSENSAQQLFTPSGLCFEALKAEGFEPAINGMPFYADFFCSKKSISGFR